MFVVGKDRIRYGASLVRICCTLAIVLLLISSAFAAGKKKKATPVPAESQKRNILEGLDLSKIVWPNPPEITRVKYLDYWSGERLVLSKDKGKKKKQGWMDRLSGVATGESSEAHPRWQLVIPNGVGIDSKGKVYIADSKVRAIFIVNPEDASYSMIKNGVDAKFQWMTGLAIDDADQLFVADSGLHKVMVFSPQHKLEAVITEGVYDPGGIAIDNENRFLYVSDAEQDLVLVYDADPPYKLLRKIGKAGTKHTSTAPGEFAKPTGVAVDADGNLFVSDTWNNRIEIFDADGNFVRTWGKAGDGPGYFARPKGLTFDSDGHVWVCDGVQDRLQVFTPDGRLLLYLGGHGIYPGKFQSLVNVTFDAKTNRVFTTEQLPGRMQIFRYFTNAEARAEFKRREEEAAKKKAEKEQGSSAASAAKPAAETK